MIKYVINIHLHAYINKF